MERLERSIWIAGRNSQKNELTTQYNSQEGVVVKNFENSGEALDFLMMGFEVPEVLIFLEGLVTDNQSEKVERVLSVLYPDIKILSISDESAMTDYKQKPKGTEISKRVNTALRRLEKACQKLEDILTKNKTEE